MMLSTRRKFFKLFTAAAANLTVASTGIYVIGSAFADLDGRITAGAKTWQDGGFGDCDTKTCDACGISQGTTCSSPGATCCYGGEAMMFCTFIGGSESGTRLICQ